MNDTDRSRSETLALRILASAAILGLIVLGRDVLVPIALAAMAAFVLAPVVRQIRRLGLGQSGASLLTLGLVALLAAGVAVVLALQLVSLSNDLPRYQTHLQGKVQAVRHLSLGPLGALGDLGLRLAPAPMDAQTGMPGAPDATPGEATTGQSPMSLLTHVLAGLWGPLGTIGVVALVLIFLLLEQDALRDRLLRLAGGQDLRAATVAFDDAAQRLSRYFASQFAVNAGVGIVTGVLLAAIGLPQPAVWAVLAALLRFVPYVGYPAAALAATAMAAAAEPGWGLTGSTLLILAVVELVAANAIEPHLYGHSTGLSPFSVVVSAIFWGAVWGPVGLLMSTPLTLCLVVAGRHVPALSFLDLLLGDTPALTLAQRFYQRSITGNLVEIVADAQTYLKKHPLARYFDQVALPAFELARIDFEAGLISGSQQSKARAAVHELFDTIAGDPSRPRRRGRRRPPSALDGGHFGLGLRQARLQGSERHATPEHAPRGSVTLCLSTGSIGSELAAELLVRVLCHQGLDARHFTLDECVTPKDEEALDALGLVFLVELPDADSPQGHRVLQALGVIRQRGLARLVLLRPRIGNGDTAPPPGAPWHFDASADSLEAAVAWVDPKAH
ncbi:AI-2E family transporter [Ideonella sp. B508-1]|uniref:AI-2E family transporter n=1 Tax=Ideonella sp. B508-1 TaxID=137716 RepID=UPI00034CAA93|nr:AI-2E family transporter [Ideonella sp. B508-1]